MYVLSNTGSKMDHWRIISLFYQTVRDRFDFSKTPTLFIKPVCRKKLSDGKNLFCPCSLGKNLMFRPFRSMSAFEDQPAR